MPVSRENDRARTGKRNIGGGSKAVFGDGFYGTFSPHKKGRELNTNFFLNFSGHPRDIPAKIPGCPAKKFAFPGFRRTYRTFLAPTPSRGRPPPHPKISGPKSLGLGSLFFPPVSFPPPLCPSLKRAVGVVSLRYRSRRNYYSINSQELHGCNAAHYSLVINSQELQDCNCNCNCNPN